jgi:hypothetical protein
MRLILALPLLALGACQVTTDDKNDQMTIEYNQDVAENGIADAANTAEDLAGKVSNDVQQTADKVENKADNLDVKVDVDTDGNKAN